MIFFSKHNFGELVQNLLNTKSWRGDSQINVSIKHNLIRIKFYRPLGSIQFWAFIS